jgi:hypothetical protein
MEHTLPGDRSYQASVHLLFSTCVALINFLTNADGLNEHG